MPDSRYTLMTVREVVQLLRNGVYKVDGDGTVLRAWTGKEDRPVKPYKGNEEGHLFVRLYHNKKRKTCAVARLVWMATTLQPIPWNFEIHHQDEDVTNNRWSNLYCLHKLDHRKYHYGADDSVPF